MTRNDTKFEIGLAMAGAISAGAYSAGVIDFMFQALDEWEKQKASGTVPNHSVCIRAAAGASAGSITAALAAAAVAGGLRPQPFAGQQQAGMQRYKCVLPALYEAWVTLPDMAAPSGEDLLATSDLEGGVLPRSILNAKILEDLTDVALKLPEAPGGSAPGPAYGGDGLPYLAKRLHLYLTLSNMRGVPYKVSFDGAGGHYMMSHGDRAHYVIEGIGIHEGENDYLREDSGLALDVATVPKDKGATRPEWKAYGLTALASAAFPVGLAARPIETNTLLYDKRQWPGLPQAAKLFKPDWPSAWIPPNGKEDEEKGYDFGFMSLDGGLIDNEPFEYARRAIMPEGASRNERDESLVSGAVLMVDPFPEPPAFSTEKIEEASILQVAKALLPMLKNQVRFKPDELAAALDNTVYSRWMIAPSRSKPNDAGDERYAIATGVLGGFGGFLDIKFREHDYQLGRRNCQKFLRDTFLVRDDNPLVYDANAKAPKWPAAAYNNKRFRDVDRKNPGSGKYYCSIIPLVGEAADEVPEPKWPQIDRQRIEQIQKRIDARLDRLAPRFLEIKSLAKYWNWALRQAWRAFGREKVRDFVHSSIEADLIRRNQITTWSSLGEDSRAVLAELKAPGYEYRTVNGAKGLCRATGLTEQQVRNSLDVIKTKRPDLWSGRVGNQECWALAEKRPGWFDRNNPLGGAPSIG